MEGTNTQELVQMLANRIKYPSSIYARKGEIRYIITDVDLGEKDEVTFELAEEES